MKKNFKILLALFSLFFFFVGYRFYAHAAEDGCSVEKKSYEFIEASYPINMVRTISTMGPSFESALYLYTVGVTPDTTMKCENYILGQLEGVGTEVYELPEEYPACDVEVDEQDEVNELCSALSSDVIASDIYARSGSPSVLVDSVKGSLIGLGTKLESAAVKGPVPVNFAYYWNQNVAKIPFAGKALAADSDGYDNLPLIKAVYDVWYLAVRVALGLLSLVLLYTGIMITMGKKISNQLVVSVQYALPKIVIGTVLIIFSYPIGALITSISFGLYKGAVPMVFNLLGLERNVPSGLLLLALVWQTLKMSSGGFLLLIIPLLMILILQITKIVLYLKVLIIYIKMAFSIVTAPIEFVLGTLPGNDAKIADWFMRMAKYGLTIFLMGLIYPITLWVGIKIMLAYWSGLNAEVGGWGMIYSLITPLLIVVFGTGVGIGMEKRIDEMLSGKKKR